MDGENHKAIEIFQENCEDINNDNEDSYEDIDIIEEYLKESEIDEESYRDIENFLPKGLSIEIIMCIIQELIDQFLILKTTHNWPDSNLDNFSYKSPEMRFKDTVIQNKDFDNIIPRNCSFMVSLFQNLLEEMTNEGKYSKFINYVNILVKMDNDDKNLLNEASKKQNEVDELRIVIENDKKDLVDKILNCMSKIGRIKDMIDNFKIESEIKLIYIKNYQNSKFEMDKAYFSEKFQNICEKIDTTNSKINMELRVHNDFQEAIIEFQQELEEQIEIWKRKYYETMEEMTKRNDLLREKHNKQLEDVANLKALYEKRQQEIHDWNIYKAEQEKIRLEKERRNKAATRIQAWWRGTMVRKGFGKFRKKKEKKPKKSSEKQKPSSKK